MTSSTFNTTHSRTANPRRLTAITLVVVACHALLIFGLPRWKTTGMSGLGSGPLITRIVSPAPSQTETAPAAPATAPQPPQAPSPQLEAVQPDAKAVSKKVAQAPPAREASRQQLPDTATGAPNTRGATVAAPGTGQDRESSILAMPAPPQFGPFPAPSEIGARPPASESQAARASIKSASDAPVSLPRSAKVTYRVSGMMDGVDVAVPSTLNWRHDGSHYEIDWVFYHVKVGERSLFANGLITPQGLAPLNSSYRTDIRRDTRFDYEAQRLRLGADATDVPLTPGTQDRLSLIVQLSSLISAAPERYPAGSAIKLPVTWAGQTTPAWTAIVDGDDIVQGADGKPLRTLRLRHEPEPGDDRKLEVWLAPALEYLPARMRITESNGNVLDYTVQLAYGVQVLPPPLAAMPAQ